MKTPMQEILDGCKNNSTSEWDSKRLKFRKTSYCGNKYLCPLCKKAKEERIKCIKEELEFLRDFYLLLRPQDDKWFKLTIEDRIYFLKSELKLGEGK